MCYICHAIVLPLNHGEAEYAGIICHNCDHRFSDLQVHHLRFFFVFGAIVVAHLRQVLFMYIDLFYLYLCFVFRWMLPFQIIVNAFI